MVVAPTPTKARVQVLSLTIERLREVPIHPHTSILAPRLRQCGHEDEGVRRTCSNHSEAHPAEICPLRLLYLRSEVTEAVPARVKPNDGAQVQLVVCGGIVAEAPARAPL
jgi:hypothetical protein